MSILKIRKMKLSNVNVLGEEKPNELHISETALRELCQSINMLILLTPPCHEKLHPWTKNPLNSRVI